MSAPYQDGLYPSGAPIITMLGGATFKCNKLTLDKAAETVNITDPDGSHAGALSFIGPRTGSAELQFANVNVAEPTTAAYNANTGVFAANVDGANVNVFITHVAIERPQRGPWVATCAIQIRQN